jgi:Zn-dependent protease with chaperone function
VNRPDDPNGPEHQPWTGPAQPPPFGQPGQPPTPAPFGHLPTPGQSGVPGPSNEPSAQLPPAEPRRQLPSGDSYGNPGGRSSDGRPNASTASALIAAAPWFIWSFILMVWIAVAVGLPWGWVVVVLWLLSGAVTFFGGLEDLLARYLFRLRQPTLVEQQRLGPVWANLLQKTGQQDSRFALWLQESADINATPTPGHNVATTTWSLYTLPPSHLEAVLAHELSHHLGGRGRLSLISFWYSIPARAVLICVRAVARVMRKYPVLGFIIGAFVVLSYLGTLLAVLAFGRGYIWPILFLTPFVAPPILAWLNRWQVRQADQQTVAMGYGNALVQVLYGWQTQHQQTFGQPVNRRTQVMSSTPSVVDRVRTLEQAGARPF